jgi:hypothetical protein
LVAATRRTSDLAAVDVPPTRWISPSWMDAQDLGLRGAGHVADLVEEDRAAVAELELARLLVGRRR